MGMFSWKDVGIPLISAILGSSLLGIFATGYVSEFSKPRLDFSVSINPDPFSQGEHDLLEYQIILRNIGGGQASNVTMFAFVPGNIVYSYSPLHGQSVTFGNPIRHIKDPIKPYSELRANMSTFNQDGVIYMSLYTKDPSPDRTYYLAISYDQGSSDAYYLGNDASKDIHSVFHYLLQGRQGFDIPIDQKILWTALGLSIICFAIAAGTRWKIFGKRAFREKVLLVIAASAIILLVVEVLPIAYLMDLGDIVTTDLSIGIPLDVNLTLDNGVTISQVSLLVNLGWILSILFLLRGVIGYLVFRKLSTIDFKSLNLTANTKAIFKIFDRKSILLIGSFFVFAPPLYGTITLFFNNFAFHISLYSLFIFSLIFDIGRMYFMIFVFARRLFRQ